MLVSKSKYSDGDIISMKISNGDEVVAKYVGESSEWFEVTKPMVVVTTQKGIVLMPALFTSEPGTNQMRFAHIMLHGLTDEQMKAHYIGQTTGIQTIPKSSIIT